MTTQTSTPGYYTFSVGDRVTRRDGYDGSGTVTEATEQQALVEWDPTGGPFDAFGGGWVRHDQLVPAADTFRACYWLRDDRQGDVLLTGREHSHLTDDELIAEATAEAARAGVDLGDGQLVIGAWRGR